MDDEEAAAFLLKAYRGACDCYDSAEHGNHPSYQVNQWSRNARNAAKAGDETGGLGFVEIMNKPKQGEDENDEGDPDLKVRQSVTGGGRPAGNSGPHSAQDGARNRTPTMANSLAGYRRLPAR